MGLFFLWSLTSRVEMKHMYSNLDPCDMDQQGSDEWCQDIPKWAGKNSEKATTWLVVSTHLKNIGQIWNLPQIGVNIKNIWNHHLDTQ